MFYGITHFSHNHQLNWRRSIKFNKKNKIDKSLKQSSKSVLIEDKVKSPQTVRGLDEARKLLNSAPDIRGKKVAQIRKQLDNGTYKIDGQKIAFKMIKESLTNK